MSTLREVLGSMRRGGKARLECPRCGGPVRRSRTPLQGWILPVLEGWVLPVKYACDKCGYSGFLAMEEEPGDTRTNAIEEDSTPRS